MIPHPARAVVTTPSELAARRHCPLAWAWRRDGRAETDPDQDQDAAEVGLAVHAVLASLASIRPAAPEASRALLARGLPRDQAEWALELVLAGWRLLPPLGVPVEAEVPIEVEVGPHLLRGRADLVVRWDRGRGLEGPGPVEVWDWKTGASPPPGRDELERDVQVVTYLAWARGQDPRPDAPLPLARWIYLAHGPRTVAVSAWDGMEAWLAREVAHHVRAAELPAERSPARPGAGCQHCPYRSGCDPLRAWLDAPLSAAQAGSGWPVLARAYAHARDRATAAVAVRADLGARVRAMLPGDRAEQDGVRVTRVQTRHRVWPAAVVGPLAAALGRDEAGLWRAIGKPDRRAVEELLLDLPVQARDELEALVEVSTREHMRVTEIGL